MKKRVCIISFSPLHQDARVLRQVEYLSPLYDITIIGHGKTVPTWPNVTWHIRPRPSIPAKIIFLFALLSGRLFPKLYSFWYWRLPRYSQAYQIALASQADVIHANDINTLPIAMRVKKQCGAKVILDAHEY